MFKTATDARSAYLEATATLTTVLLTSIGETNRKAIAHPIYDTQLHTPRTIVDAMTTMHGVFTQTDVDSLQLPLTVKLPSLSVFEAHVADFRHALAALHLAGQLPLPLDQYRALKSSLTPFPQFGPYLIQYTISNPLVGQQTFDSLVNFLLPQMPNIIASTTTNPFAGSFQPHTPHLARSHIRR